MAFAQHHRRFILFTILFGINVFTACNQVGPIQIEDEVGTAYTITWDTEALEDYLAETPSGSPSNEDADTGTTLPFDSDEDYQEDTASDTDTGSDYPQNVILFIGDGMGIAHMDAASIYAYGEPGNIYFEDFPVFGEVSTFSANSEITDSAAAATAMGTGQKVNNSVVGLQLPGDGSDLPNLTEYFHSIGKSVGLVTTCTITHATPAGFGAHTASRSNTTEIADDYLTQSRPNILFGGGGSGMTRDGAETAGYTVIETVSEINEIDIQEEYHLTGQFGVGFLPYEYSTEYTVLPHLWEMTQGAITALMQSPNGFFLMVEGGRIDHACHSNNLEAMIYELLAFEQTVEQTLGNHQLDDTLIIVTSDHRTGGLSIDTNNGIGELPDVSWSTMGHTGDPVPIYVTGAGHENFADEITAGEGLIDNTDIFRILTEEIDWQNR